ncbi:MAG: M15 family metallopeptidase [Planctomycetia bacterium]
MVCGVLVLMLTATAAAEPAGTVDDPIVDCAFTEAEAFDGLSPDCPPAIRDRQVVLTVTYFGFDSKIHRGQIVVDQDLAGDVEAVFAVALKTKFPLRSVVPVSHPRYRKDRTWSDDLSMAANNTSSFNYRAITGGKTLSNHALGRAVDVNPLQNPYIKGKIVLPPGAKYDPSVPGTLTPDHPVTKAFLARGWKWGGDWTGRPDYQHFEKPPKDAP